MAKFVWASIVCIGFLGAGFLISKAYNEWQDHPIATSITTHPIEDLDFPNVTICPPKDSNTALYYDLVKAGNGTLSDKDRTTLKEAATQILLTQTHMEYVKKYFDDVTDGEYGPDFVRISFLAEPLQTWTSGQDVES